MGDTFDKGRLDMAAAVARVEPSLAPYGVILALALLAPKVAASGFLVFVAPAVLGPAVRLPRPRWRRTG